MHNLKPSDLDLLLKKVKQWIDDLLDEHSSSVTPVVKFCFSNLPLYYSSRILNFAKVILVDKVPVPPLAEMGFAQFENLNDFVKGNYAGITYKDTYFLRRELKDKEVIHFHELVHIVQWEYLGIEKFLSMYAKDLLEYRYWDSPLECMARKHEELFNQRVPPYDIEKRIKNELNMMR